MIRCDRGVDSSQLSCQFLRCVVVISTEELQRPVCRPTSPVLSNSCLTHRTFLNWQNQFERYLSRR
jgi:hypothetical protein